MPLHILEILCVSEISSNIPARRRELFESAEWEYELKHDALGHLVTSGKAAAGSFASGGSDAKNIQGQMYAGRSALGDTTISGSITVGYNSCNVKKELSSQSGQTAPRVPYCECSPRDLRCSIIQKNAFSIEQ
jgi:hypothetical protein